MEKANKKIAEVEIEMKDGTKKSLTTLTSEDFPKVKLDGKADDKGVFTSLSLKRGIVKDTPTEYVERRCFKYANADMVMYDLTIPITEATFNAIPFANRIDLYSKALRIDRDHDQVVGGGKPIEEKILDKAEKLGLPANVIADMKKALVKHGFGK